MQEKCEQCGSRNNVRTVQFTKGKTKGQRVNLCAECRKK